MNEQIAVGQTVYTAGGRYGPPRIFMHTVIAISDTGRIAVGHQYSSPRAGKKPRPHYTNDKYYGSFSEAKAALVGYFKQRVDYAIVNLENARADLEKAEAVEILPAEKAASA